MLEGITLVTLAVLVPRPPLPSGHGLRPGKGALGPSLFLAWGLVGSTPCHGWAGCHALG